MDRDYIDLFGLQRLMREGIGELFPGKIWVRAKLASVQAKANGEVVAEKIMTVEGGSWRVVQMDITLDAGEYTIDIGGQIGSITIE